MSSAPNDLLSRLVRLGPRSSLSRSSSTTLGRGYFRLLHPSPLSVPFELTVRIDRGNKAASPPPHPQHSRQPCPTPPLPAETSTTSTSSSSFKRKRHDGDDFPVETSSSSSPNPHNPLPTSPLPSSSLPSTESVVDLRSHKAGGDGVLEVDADAGADVEEKRRARDESGVDIHDEAAKVAYLLIGPSLEFRGLWLAPDSTPSLRGAGLSAFVFRLYLSLSVALLDECNVGDRSAEEGGEGDGGIASPLMGGDGENTTKNVVFETLETGCPITKPLLSQLLSRHGYYPVFSKGMLESAAKATAGGGAPRPFPLPLDFATAVKGAYPSPPVGKSRPLACFIVKKPRTKTDTLPLSSSLSPSQLSALPEAPLPSSPSVLSPSPAAAREHRRQTVTLTSPKLGTLESAFSARTRSNHGIDFETWDENRWGGGEGGSCDCGGGGSGDAGDCEGVGRGECECDERRRINAREGLEQIVVNAYFKATLRDVREFVLKDEEGGLPALFAKRKVDDDTTLKECAERDWNHIEWCEMKADMSEES